MLHDVSPIYRGLKAVQHPWPGGSMSNRGLIILDPLFIVSPSVNTRHWLDQVRDEECGHRRRADGDGQGLVCGCSIINSGHVAVSTPLNLQKPDHQTGSSHGTRIRGR